VDGIIGILADIHANPCALEVVFQDANDVGEWLFLGDAVGYGPFPVETLQILRSMVQSENWLIGNHDAYLAGIIARPTEVEAAQTLDDHKLRIEAVPEISKWYQDIWRRFNALLQQRSNGYMNVSFIHGSLPIYFPEDIIKRYLFPWPDWKGINQLDNAFQALSRLDASDCYSQVLIHGHTHVPSFAFKERQNSLYELKPIRYNKPQPLDRYEQAVICPGSVGLPRNPDPHTHAAYGVLNLNDSTFEFRRVEYNPSLLFEEMQRRRYPLPFVYLIQGAYPGNPMWGPPMDWVWSEWSRIYIRKDWGWDLNQPVI
jgi:predicted phosphodiesterase